MNGTCLVLLGDVVWTKLQKNYASLKGLFFLDKKHYEGSCKECEMYFIVWNFKEGVASFHLAQPNVLQKLCNNTFYAPGLKGLPGASSNRIVRLSVCLSVCLSVILSRLQTKCNI